MRDLRLLASSAVLALLASGFLFPSGCASSGRRASARATTRPPGRAGRSRRRRGPRDGGVRLERRLRDEHEGARLRRRGLRAVRRRADCPTGQKCDAQHACVGCLTSADCSAGQRCVNSACASGCDATSTLPRGGRVRHGDSACVGCLGDGNCAAPTPKCDTSSTTASRCLTTPDCAAGTVCNAERLRPRLHGVATVPDGAGVQLGGLRGVPGQLAVPRRRRPGATRRQHVRPVPAVQRQLPHGPVLLRDVVRAGLQASSTARRSRTRDRRVRRAAGRRGRAAGAAAGTDLRSDDHVCVQCPSTATARWADVREQTCARAATRSTACPRGDGCCSGQCQPLNTTSNCGACGAACDTTSGNSQGAACVNAGLHVHGLRLGMGRLHRRVPRRGRLRDEPRDRRREAVLGGDVRARPGRAAPTRTARRLPRRSPATRRPGMCATPGARAVHRRIRARSSAPGPRAATPIDGTCNTIARYPATPASATARRIRRRDARRTPTRTPPTAGPATVDARTRTSRASRARAAFATRRARAAGATAPTRSRQPPTTAASRTSRPATARPAARQGLCADPHSNGQGQTYDDCSPLGTPGNAATYSQTMASEAAARVRALRRVDPHRQLHDRRRPGHRLVQRRDVRVVVLRRVLRGVRYCPRTTATATARRRARARTAARGSEARGRPTCPRPARRAKPDAARMPTERKRPLYLVLALLGALALGTTGARSGWAAVALYREPLDSSLAGPGRLRRGRPGRARVPRRGVPPHARRREAARLAHRGGDARARQRHAALLDARARGQPGARAALVQLVVAQAALNAASYWLLGDVLEAELRWREASQAADVHETCPQREHADEILRMSAQGAARHPAHRARARHAGQRAGGPGAHPPPRARVLRRAPRGARGALAQRWGASTASRTTSPTRSPPARSSSGRRASSRSSSRTRSTRARRA